MNVLMLNGSPRPDGCTARALREIGGVEADAVISRIDIDTDTDVDGGVTENKTYYVDYQNAEGQIATAKLGNPPFGAAVGTAMRVKYLPEKPKYVSCVK